jgi:hypothetical protein
MVYDVILIHMITVEGSYVTVNTFKAIELQSFLIHLRFARELAITKLNVLLCFLSTFLISI